MKLLDTFTYKGESHPRRIRFAPPQPRGKGVVLNPRDYLIFELINRHGPLPSNYLYELTRHLPDAKDKSRFQKRLTKLYNMGYLCRPDWQQSQLWAHYAPLIYDLAPAAQVALDEMGVRLIKRTDYHLHRFM